MKPLYAMGFIVSLILAVLSWLGVFSASHFLQGFLWIIVAMANGSHFMESE